MRKLLFCSAKNGLHAGAARRFLLVGLLAAVVVARFRLLQALYRHKADAGLVSDDVALDKRVERVHGVHDRAQLVEKGQAAQQQLHVGGGGAAADEDGAAAVAADEDNAAVATGSVDDAAVLAAAAAASAGEAAAASLMGE